MKITNQIEIKYHTSDTIQPFDLDFWYRFYNDVYFLFFYEPDFVQNECSKIQHMVTFWKKITSSFYFRF